MANQAPKPTPKSHEFEGLPEFNRAIQHIVTVPKKAIDEKMRETQEKRRKNKRKK